MVDFTALSDAGGVEVLGVDFSQATSPELREALIGLFNNHGLLLFRNQRMTKQILLSAAGIFGEPEVHLLGLNNDREVPEVAVVSTRGRDGNVAAKSDDELVGHIEWHTDQAYTPTPNRATMMWAVELPPEGGMTGFVDRQKVYEGLSEGLKASIKGLTVIQSWRKAQNKIAQNPNYSTDEGAKMLKEDRFPDLGYALVQRHPVTGRNILHAPPMWSSGILELPNAEGSALLDEIIEFSLRPEFVYWQKYRPNDVVLWDNWRFMHAASGTKGRYSRLMYRTVLKGGPVFGRPLDAPGDPRPVAALVD
jgi:taurine dioxygenase